MSWENWVDPHPYILCHCCGCYHHPENMAYNDFWESYHCPICDEQLYCKGAVYAWFAVQQINTDASNKQYRESKIKKT